MRAINLAIRFLLEICALAALSYSGYHAPLPEAGKIALAIAAPLLLGILWGLFAAHKARFPPSRGVKAFLGFLLLEAAAGSLVLVGEPVLAGVFAVVIAVNTGVIYRLDYQ